MRDTLEHPTVSTATLDDHAAAQYLGVSVSYLRASRLATPRTEGPPFVRLGRTVRYVRTDLDDFLAARRVTRARE